mmetsp:Transcript_14458/g.16592  ORF Transcript_14458/g.16592 Transcript_14458/m.16592 type:complete len:83 (+) Transcript_14458:349-597(+)
MLMRRPNQEWMEAMQIYLKEVIQYLAIEQLWAYKGGPIIMGQVENELGDEIDFEIDRIITLMMEKGLFEMLLYKITALGAGK